jgi:nucleotide-binding universal stress UspA family protein
VREKNCAERLRLVQESFSKSGLTAKTIIPEGHSPAKELLKIARNHSIELIVAGTESKTGIERLLLGSTAEQLIRNAPCPVLTVGPKVVLPADGPLAFSRILYATDYSREAAKAAMFALAFAEDSGAKLTCCYVEQVGTQNAATRTFVDEQFKNALMQFIPHSSSDWCTPEYFVEHGKTDEALLALAEKVGADLIVLGARKPLFWFNCVNKGLTPSVLAKAACPIVTVSSFVR